MGLDLRDLRKPLDVVTFPNGVQHQPVPFGPTEYQLWRDMMKEPDPFLSGSMAIAIIRACYPTVTDEDILDCDGDMALALAAYPGGKIEQIRAALKNGDASAAPNPASPPTREVQADTTPSSPKMSGATSSRRLRRKRGKTGGESTTASPTDGLISSGSLITTSTSPTASIRFVESSTTSTVPS